jgi:hypothetical protein
VAWSQVDAQARYLKGGLAAVYPDVYGVRGLREKIPDPMPIDRFQPSRKTLEAQLANGVIDQVTFDRHIDRAV